MLIIPSTSRNERRQMKKIVQKTTDKNYARRIMGILLLDKTRSVPQVAGILCCAESSVWRWLKKFREHGWAGLQSLPAGRHIQWHSARYLPLFYYFLEHAPQQFGYIGSRWSLSFFVFLLRKYLHITLSISTLYRYFCKQGIVWRRAAPTLKQPDPEYDEKMARIAEALSRASEKHPVVYEDEVDIDFNPKIGADWYFKGQQKRIVTPGQNQKYYFAGCLDAQTGKLVSTGYTRKNSDLVIKMLEALKRAYREAETLSVILDNYGIHKSKKVRAWLLNNPTVTLLFLPVYSPWLNKIERLWQSLHETVTRNHCCQFMWQLIRNVKIFLKRASLTDWKEMRNIRVSPL
ncbi:IS630 family transposase [Xenorhabdus nematophila]|uniref:IS630 family transposase n=3 Tax=Xenorhabdus nematophila TaxID=628 RepID=UPI000E6715DC|nr:IS630 family transposase [Xenorhabdus nematophila]AYA41147.1 IS630 family transposase [Xenorhabdus nematophila]